MYLYKSSLRSDYGVNSFVKKMGSLAAKVVYGSWLHFTFMVFEYKDKRSEKMSVDYSEFGIRIRYEERVFENRRDFAIDYETKCNTYVEDIL